jgi:hypothetical protein
MSLAIEPSAADHAHDWIDTRKFDDDTPFGEREAIV